ERDGPDCMEGEDAPGGGGAEDRKARDLEETQPIAERPSAVRLLDAAGERALAADAGAVGVGEARTGKGARREDERVPGRERLDGGGAHLDEGLGDQGPAGLDHGLAVELPLRGRTAGEVDGA